MLQLVPILKSFFQVENLLPSVKSLQEHLTPQNSFHIDGWQVGYESDVTKWPLRGQCKKSALELLHGFFEFFANFDYTEMVISPYEGLAIAKNEMSQKTYPHIKEDCDFKFLHDALTHQTGLFIQVWKSFLERGILIFYLFSYLPIFIGYLQL